jgi:hypothetical protein
LVRDEALLYHRRDLSGFQCHGRSILRSVGSESEKSINKKKKKRLKLSSKSSAEKEREREREREKDPRKVI